MSAPPSNAPFDAPSLLDQPRARVRAWDRTPNDLRTLGYGRDAGHLFGRLQRLATWDAEGPVLGREARDFVGANLDLRLPTIASIHPSADGSQRVVLALDDDERIEAVHMPRPNGRVTICLSSQVGCAMGCTFCATARIGLRRNLTAHEIIGQLFALLLRFGPRDASSLNLVFMGMGEPLHNVDAVVRTLDVLCDTRGLGVAPSRITVSTVGHVTGLDRLRTTAKHLPELAISVNAIGERRRSLMPVDRKWSLADLRAALDRWPREKKLLFEYVLLRGENDDLGSATLLAQWARGLRHVVNLIPFNAWDGSPYVEPSEEVALAFATRLREEGSIVKIRRSRGRDARGACGTLAGAAQP